MRITTLVTPLGVDPYGESVLVFRELSGKEALNTLFDYKLLMHANSESIDPAQLLGQAVTVSVKDQHDNDVYLNALVSEFSRIGRDQHLTLYQATLSPWLALATLSQDCRIFENIAAPDLIEQILNGYGYPIERRLRRNYSPLRHTVQYNESDYHFVCRLMEDAGIGYHFEHEDGKHTLVLTDTKSSYRSIPSYDSISFNSPRLFKIDGAEEMIEHWYPSQRIKSGSWSTSAYDYRQPYANLAAIGAGGGKNHAHDDQSVYHFGGQQRYQDYGAGQKLAQLEHDQQEQHFKTIEGDAKVRAILMGATGSAFQLTNHPIDAENQEVLLVSSTMSLKENPSHSSGSEHTEWQVSFTVIPTQHQYRPLRITPMVRIQGAQTALVVGPAGQEIWTNDLSEVKIQTWWDRTTPDGGWAQWVRVGSGWTGNAHGDIMIPRIGDEVIVQFLDGNPSHPIIISRVANSRRTPHAFSNTGKLPGNQALAGIRSRELGGARYNHLLFDDSTGQIRTQLESEHASTQLNLGFLVHPRDVNATPRGEGFELRTDEAGTARAAKGLLLTTDPQPGSRGPQLERAGLAARLARAEAIIKTLADLSKGHQADDTDQEDIQAVVAAIANWDKGQNTGTPAPDGGAPTLAATGPANVTLAAELGTAVVAGRTLDLVSGRDSNLSVGRRLAVRAAEAISLFAHKLGMKLIAATGDVVVQAQQDNVQIGAAKDVRVYSTGGELILESPKGITLRAGGTTLRLDPSNVDIKCTGTNTQKAANFVLSGPASESASLPPMPTSKLNTDERFVLRFRGSQLPVKMRRYEIKLDDGRVIGGTSDAQGNTELAQGEAMHIADITIFKPDGS